MFLAKGTPNHIINYSRSLLLCNLEFDLKRIETTGIGNENICKSITYLINSIENFTSKLNDSLAENRITDYFRFYKNCYSDWNKVEFSKIISESEKVDKRIELINTLQGFRKCMKNHCKKRKDYLNGNIDIDDKKMLIKSIDEFLNCLNNEIKKNSKFKVFRRKVKKLKKSAKKSLYMR